MTRNKLGKTLLVQALLALAVTAAGATTRLAIGTLGLNQDNRDGVLADLVAHELSTTPGLELVERRELDAALTEASLSVSAHVRAGDAVRRVAFVSASGIKRIQLDKEHAWIQVSCGVDSYPDAGNAWTGVYRVARASVEPRSAPRP